MGYCSQVALCVRTVHKAAMMADPNVVTCLSDADETLEDEDGMLYHWDSVKWYNGSVDVDALMGFLHNIDDSDDFLFIRLGEDDSDTDIEGGWWDNPFDMGYARRIEFCNPSASLNLTRIMDLKSLNTRAGVTDCAQCGEALSDPGLGPTYKHCPMCEP